jgi:hypothetical protein
MSITEEDLPDTISVRADLLYEAAKRVTDVYDNATARSFLRSSNPSAGDRSLLELTAMCGTEEDTAAAREIVNGAVEAFLT